MGVALLLLAIVARGTILRTIFCVPDDPMVKRKLFKKPVVKTTYIPTKKPAKPGQPKPEPEPEPEPEQEPEPEPELEPVRELLTRFMG